MSEIKTKKEKYFYLYKCRNEDCGEIFESKAEGSKMFPKSPKVKCPLCKQRTLDLILEMPFFYITGNNGVTVGTYMERRRKQLGEAECQEREAKAVEKKERDRQQQLERPLPRGMKRVERPKPENPWWRPDNNKPDSSLNSLTNEQKTHYIMTGEKPLSDKGLRV